MLFCLDLQRYQFIITRTALGTGHTSAHSLANSHSCLTPAKNEGTDIDSSGPIAEGMINQQTKFVYL